MLNLKDAIPRRTYTDNNRKQTAYRHDAYVGVSKNRGARGLVCEQGYVAGVCLRVYDSGYGSEYYSGCISEYVSQGSNSGSLHKFQLLILERLICIERERERASIDTSIDRDRGMYANEYS